jgi:hypothetical protein
MLIIVAMLLAAIALYKGYDLYKFPPGSTAGHAELLRKYVPVWPGHPAIALLALTLSLGTSSFLYNPTLVLGLAGLRAWCRTEPAFCISIAVATTVFTLFIASITFFKGDPSWGPRYFTPVFAALWVFASRCYDLLSRRLTVGLLLLGFMVQLGALSIDPHRLYVERGLPSGFCVSNPELYFHPSISHLLHRPREILEAFESRKERAECFTPAPAATFAFPVLDFVERGPESVRKYQVLRGFRFWWSSFQALDDPSRPVDVARTVALLALVAGAGLIMQVTGASKP